MFFLYTISFSIQLHLYIEKLKFFGLIQVNGPSKISYYEGKLLENVSSSSKIKAIMKMLYVVILIILLLQ